MKFLADDLFELNVNAEELLSSPVGIAIIVVGFLIVLMAIISGGVSIFLAIKYLKFNKRENMAGLTGKDAARELLDKNGLEKIKVKATGSLLFGNSYSHYFKKVRLRRLTWKKRSISSLAMAAQKTGLAVLDKENDKDMRKRVVLTPVINFGPLAFIGIIIVGVVIDFLMYNTVGVASLISGIIGLLFMVLSFWLQLTTLKTEVKAQEKAYDMLKKYNLATDDELEDMKELFKLYNIEYVNNIIIAFLEILYRVLVIIFNLTKGSNLSSSSSND